MERSGGCGIILIAVPDVEIPSWCPQAAAALVTEWSSHGARILLADVSLAQPALHEVFALPNSEGVVDVMMNGAQLRNVSRLVGSPDFLFISAGMPTGDIADVMRSGRWDVVLEALGEAEFHLVMYAPADLPGLDVLLERGPAVLLLGRDPEAAEEAIRNLGLSATDGLGTPVDEGIPGGVGAPSEPLGVAEPVANSFGVLEPVVGAFEVLSDGADSKETVSKLSFLRRVPLWMVGTVLALLVLAAWVGSRVLGGEEAVSLEVLEERVQPPVPVVAPAPETPQAYSLSLAAFEDPRVAALRAENLRAQRADLLFTTVPVLVSGRVFHRILAGPAPDSAAAEELRTSLGESLSNEDASVWIVRATPFAFALGDYESREAADHRAEEMPLASLAPYVFEVGFVDRPSFRVYAGTYADSAEASVAHERFMEAGEDLPQLVRRVGRYVARP